MLGPFEWYQTVRVLYQLARFYPELIDCSAPPQSVPDELKPLAAPGPCEWQDGGYGAIVNSEFFPIREGSAARYRVTYPTSEGPHPAIVFSGGGGDDGSGYLDLAHHWASHGFVVLQPVHFDSFTHYHHVSKSKVWAHWRTTWDVWGLVLGEERMWRARCNDISRLLDEIGDFDGRIDTNNIGIGGYSYGAHVACLMGGAQLMARNGRFSMPEKRFKAVLSISGEHGAKRLPKSVWKTLSAPFLLITGDRDKTVWGRDFREKLEAYRHAPDGNKEKLIVAGANHFALSGRLWETAKHPADVAAQTAIFDIVRGATTKFWKEQLSAA